MKNEELYKTPEERKKAFDVFCHRHAICNECPAKNKLGDCKFAWLTLEAERKNLFPCPFCGGKATEIKVLDYAVAMQCDRCHATSGIYDNKDEAIAAWNRRAK